MTALLKPLFFGGGWSKGLPSADSCYCCCIYVYFNIGHIKESYGVWFDWTCRSQSVLIQAHGEFPDPAGLLTRRVGSSGVQEQILMVKKS